jgi:uncharacterized membrane protein
MGGKTGRDSLMEIKEKPHKKTQAMIERIAGFLRPFITGDTLLNTILSYQKTDRKSYRVRFFKAPLFKAMLYQSATF